MMGLENSFTLILWVFLICWRRSKIHKKYKQTRLIHISTDEVYGDVLKGRSTETWPYKPSSPYAASKASLDRIFSYFRTFNLPVIVTNCSNNYGPRQHPENYS